MPDIPEITGVNIDIKDIRIGNIQTYRYTTPTIPVAPPVTVDIGTPIVDIPGCVEAHETNNAKNNQVKSDDERGLVTYCDSGIPSFDPIQYEPEQMIITTPAPVPKTDTPDPPESPEIESPKINPPTDTAKVDCPTEAQALKEPVGHIKGDEKVTEYRLVGNECIQVTEKLTIPDQIVGNIPSAGAVTATASIAVVATTSALLAKPLADLLLKAVKPAVKKVMKKIASLRGKQPPVKSKGERQAEQRQMNSAVKALRSVFPRRKKKRKKE